VTGVAPATRGGRHDRPPRRDAAAEARIDAILAHWTTADADFDRWEQQVVRLKSLGVLDAVAWATAIDDGRAAEEVADRLVLHRLRHHHSDLYRSLLDEARGLL